MADKEIINDIIELDKSKLKIDDCLDFPNKGRRILTVDYGCYRFQGYYSLIYGNIERNRATLIEAIKEEIIRKIEQDNKEEYCKEQNLKYDTTACENLNIINKAKEENEQRE